MKWRGFQKTGFFLIGLVMVIAAGCSALPQEEKEEPIRIGVSIYRGDDAFIASMAAALESEVTAMEKEIGQKINLKIEDAKNNQNSQNEQVGNFINKGYDAVCVNMVDRTAAYVMIDKAREVGIPIIFFNREPVEEDMQSWNGAYYVGTEADRAGEMQGDIIVQAYQKDPTRLDKNGDGKIQYVILEGEQVHQDALIRTESSVQTIMDAGIEMEKLASGSGNWMRTSSYEQMLSWINEFGDSIELVLSNNDEMALGALEALEEQNRIEGGPVVVGIDGIQDGIEEIEKGRMLGTVENNAKEQAQAILRISCAGAQEKKVKEVVDLKDGHYVRIPHRIITKEILDRE